MSRARAVLAKLVEQAAATSNSPHAAKAASMLGRCFKQQVDFILDPAKRKTLLCPRRAGKSFAFAVYLFWVALSIPGANCVFATLTRLRAKKILWRLLKRLDKDFELGCTFNETELTVTLDNGSLISLAGCETTADIDKFRGEYYHLFLLDETKSFPGDLLDELLEDSVEPALADYGGTLCLGGTPGSVLEGAFYHATGPSSSSQWIDEEGQKRAITVPYLERNDPRWASAVWEWSGHSWSVADNTAQPHLWKEALALKARKGWSNLNPKWIREYLGQWIADDGELVYAYHEQRNAWTPGQRTPANPFGLPGDHEWRYILGVDLGFDAAFALQVAAYSETCPDFFQVYEYTAPGLHVTPIAESIRAAERACGGFECMVGDRGGLGKMIFATLEREHGISIEAAEKQEKRTHIELLNSDLIDGRCKILPSSKLAKEMKALVWEDSTRKREDEKLPKDNCDAWLYIRTKALHHFSSPAAIQLAKGSPEYQEQLEEQALINAEAREQRKWDHDAVGDTDGDGWFG